MKNLQKKFLRSNYMKFAFILLSTFSACSQAQKDAPQAKILGHSETQILKHPEWSKNATIYEMNVRQHTPEGTFAAAQKDLPRLKALGVDILWLMPIHPIGEVNRKGGMGSHYSVKDYKGVNPDYGNAKTFKTFVDSAHANGIKVILDWVANHSAFDNVWTLQHPEYYLPDANGKIQPPLGTDWWDVAQLDYNQKGLWSAMADAMKFWVKEFDIDGFRCDVAEKVPTPFWDFARASLDSIKPVFMLAEAERKEHHLKAFDMSYTWEFMHICNDIAAGKKNLNDIDSYMARQDTAFPKNAYRMYFTTNHDENSWNGTGNERLKANRNVYDVLAFTIGGMPLIYSGQEGGEQRTDGSPHRLRFFEKDTVQWNNYPHSALYQKLLQLHHDNPALWNGEFGGKYARIHTGSDETLFCFKRSLGNSEVVVMLNFSDRPSSIDLIDPMEDVNHISIFNDKSMALYTKGKMELPPHGYQVFVKK